MFLFNSSEICHKTLLENKFDRISNFKEKLVIVYFINIITIYFQTMHHGKCQPKMFIKKTAQFPKKLLLLQEKIFCFKAWNNVFGQPLIFLTYRPHYKWWLCMIYVARYNIPVNVKNKNLMYLFWYVWKNFFSFSPCLIAAKKSWTLKISEDWWGNNFWQEWMWLLCK